MKAFPDMSNETSSHLELRPMVQEFAQEMERKLRTNDKTDNKQLPDVLEFLTMRLAKEYAEFLEEVYKAESGKAILLEAVDVANFCAMIAALYKAIPKVNEKRHRTLEEKNRQFADAYSEGPETVIQRLKRKFEEDRKFEKLETIHFDWTTDLPRLDCMVFNYPLVSDNSEKVTCKNCLAFLIKRAKNE